jgi:hypothetical protein
MAQTLFGLAVVSLLLAVASAHPTFYTRDALNPACDDPSTIYSFHIHVLFW